MPLPLQDGADELFPIAAAKVEKSRSHRSEPHLGQTGDRSDTVFPTKSSNLFWQSRHLYSYSGMVSSMVLFSDGGAVDDFSHDPIDLVGHLVQPAVG